MLATVRTVIVDEIHAVIGSRRGRTWRCRSTAAARHRPSVQRIGLSATQKPIEDVAKWLVGIDGDACTIVNEGHGRPMDLDIELPRSELDTVMAHEVWGEYYDRLAELAQAHRTTLVFVNTRKLAERLARHSERAPRRRPRRHASRKPLEGVASRRRNPAQGRAAARAGRDRVAGARASTSGRWIWCARSDRRTPWPR
jgi:Lhr-like helicase